MGARSKILLAVAIGGLVVVSIFAAQSKEQGVHPKTSNSIGPNLPGLQMKCVGGKLDPVCVGHRLSMAAQFGDPATKTWLDSDKGGGGIEGYYIGGKACRFYFVKEDSVQCIKSPCEIIKQIACE